MSTRRRGRGTPDLSGYATDAELQAAINGLGILQGEPGPEGPPGPAGPIGPAGLTFRGTWSNTATYAQNDLVSYEGSGYFVHTAPPVGTLPTNTAHWTLLVLQGAPGDRGPAGPSGGGALGAKLTAAIDATQTTLTASLTAEWPTGTVDSRILIDSEIMRVSNIALANGVYTLTVARGQLGTIAATHKLNAVLLARTPFDVPTRADVAAAVAAGGTTTLVQSGGYSANGSAPTLAGWGLLSSQSAVRTGQANTVDAGGAALIIRTSTTSGNVASWSTPVVTSREAKGKLRSRFRLDGELTNRRDTVGLYGGTVANTAGATDPTGPFLILQFDTGAGHTTWQFVSRLDGTGPVLRVDTGVVPDVTTVLDFEIDLTGTDVVMRLLSGATVLATHTVAAADAPALTAQLGWLQAVATLTTVARGTVGYAGSLTNGR